MDLSLTFPSTEKLGRESRASRQDIRIRNMFYPLCLLHANLRISKWQELCRCALMARHVTLQASLCAIWLLDGCLFATSASKNFKETVYG